MSINRRDFLRNGSFAALGLSLPVLTKANFFDAPKAARPAYIQPEYALLGPG